MHQRLSDGNRDPSFDFHSQRRIYSSVTRPEVSSTSSPPAPIAEDIQSIAVLPFVSMSEDPENECFTDGLTEELINVLTYVPGLQVVARTSGFCFKNTVKDVHEIGAQLNSERSSKASSGGRGISFESPRS